MEPPSTIPAIKAPPTARDNPFTRSLAGVIGMVFLSAMMLVCLGTLPRTLTGAGQTSTPSEQGAPPSTPRYNAGSPNAGRLPPAWCVSLGWWTPAADQVLPLNRMVNVETVGAIATRHGVTPAAALDAADGPIADELRAHWPRYALGTDVLGRSLLIRCLTGGGISLGIGIAAAMLSVVIGTLYGSISAYAGGKVDAVMMRIVDILYGLPYVLLVVLLAVASDVLTDEYMSRTGARDAWVVSQAEAELARRTGSLDHEAARGLLADDEALRSRLESQAADLFPGRRISEGGRNAINVVTLLVAIGGVSWLTMARVIRGQVLSLKAQPFMEAARAIGAPWIRQFTRHLLPNLLGPIIVYATLTVPQAILQESFLSFLGIGVKPPLPSWGNLVAEGLGELNSYKSHWWLLVFPCVLLGTTLLALNFVGEGLREAFDPRRARR